MQRYTCIKYCKEKRVKVSKILVSQPKPASDKSPYYDIAKRHDAEVVFRPFIKVEGLSSREFRQQKISLPDYTAIIFTARAAVDHFFRLCEELRFNIPETMKYFCTNESIALYLQKYIVYRKRKVFHGTNGHIEDMLQTFVKHNKEKYLLASSEAASDKDLDLLTSHKVNVTKGVMYRTVSNDFGPDEKFDYDMLLFFSPQGIEALRKNFPDFRQGDIVIGCFGKTTADAVRNAGLRLDLEAPSDKYPSITAALDDFLKENNK